MNARRTTAAILASVTLLGASALAFQEVTLRYAWTKGETLRYSVAQRTVSTMSGLPGGMADVDVTQAIGQTLKMVVDDVAADGTVTMQQSIEAIKLEMETPMGTMGYDTATPDKLDNPAAGMMKQMFSGLIGQPFTVAMAPNGAITRIEGFDRIVETMFKGLPPSPETAGALASIRSSFSDEAMKSMFGQGFAQLQDKPVKVGDAWTRELAMKIPMFGGMTTRLGFTLKALEGSGADQVAVLAVQLTSKQDGPPAEAGPMGLSVKVEDSAGTGELRFHVAKGRFLRSTVNMTMRMAMSGAGPDGSPLNMKSLAKSESVFQLIEK